MIFVPFISKWADIFAEYRKTSDKALASDEKSAALFYDTYDAIITACQKGLDKEELSFEERKYMLEQILIVANMKFKKDYEGKISDLFFLWDLQLYNNSWSIILRFSRKT